MGEWLDLFHRPHLQCLPSHHPFLFLILLKILKATQKDVLDTVLFELVCSLDSDRKEGEHWSKSLVSPWAPSYSNDRSLKEEEGDNGLD